MQTMKRGKARGKKKEKKKRRLMMNQQEMMSLMMINIKRRVGQSKKEKTEQYYKNEKRVWACEVKRKVRKTKEMTTTKRRKTKRVEKMKTIDGLNYFGPVEKISPL